MIKYEAIYRDTKDKSIPAYVCPVVWDGASTSWMLQTFNGRKPIVYYIPADDAPSGLIEFVDYKLTADQGIRACDVMAADTEMRRNLPRPAKPAVKPESATQAPIVQKADNWTPPPPIVVPGSKSTAQDERWQPRFHKMNLERVQKGCLFAEKCLGIDYDSKEKYYRCRCVTCGKTVQASQSDLLLERIKYCAKHG